MLNLTHNIHSFNKLVHAGEWAKANNFCTLVFPVRQLSAMTLGIIGYGELGKGVEKMAQQIGMNVMVARRRGAAVADDSRHDFEEVLREADVVSLHCPLTDDTQNLINSETLKLMKPDSILINTARGGLVHSAALAAALGDGTIAAAAIDVLPEEPPVKGDPLIDYASDNLILTPHIAWATREARQAAIDGVAANFAAFLDGERLNRVA
jgi:glycerate dehydrogenase